MKNLLLIYNPFSGTQSFKEYIDEVVSILQNKGKFNVILHRMSRDVSLTEFLSSIKDSNIKVDTVCVSGGDGTINIVVNALNNLNIVAKIGLFPSGTANDFCSYLKIPKDPIDCANIIATKNTMKVDFGKINDSYFINVLCVGIFAEVSQGVDVNLKNSIGKLAYYVQGAKVLTHINPINVTITTSNETIKEKAYLILVLNGDRAGGFKLAPLSSVNDGRFDLVLFKVPSNQIPTGSLLKVLSGHHVTDENVLYLQDSKFKIEAENNELFETDIDGEKGPKMPLEITMMNKKLEIYV